MKQLKPELRKEFIESIKKIDIDLDYDEFYKEELHQFEKDVVKIVRYIQEHSFEESDKMLKANQLWG